MEVETSSATCLETAGSGCPNCSSTGMVQVYTVGGIPVHSVLLMSSQAQAREYPKGELALGFCPACGFLSNTSFDASVHEYCPRYEETQGFSETFNRFARDLAARLVRRYGLHGKTVLEIGCGKGQFLRTLCEVGGNHGIGIDPAYDPDRAEGNSTDKNVEFIQDFYSTKYSDLRADFICCRHTLEHIAPTRQFLQELRDSLGDRLDTIVLFELPDALRVLRDGAFWDIYYEHCSYFTAGSLARVFRATCFDVIDLELDYDDQYILLAARPTRRPTTPSHPLEADADTVRSLAMEFPRVVSASREHWKQRITGSHARGETTVLWGGGSKAVSFLTTLSLGDEVAAAVDINPFKHGKFLPGTGHQTVAPEQLREMRPDHVVAMNAIYQDEIQRELQRLGVEADLCAL